MYGPSEGRARAGESRVTTRNPFSAAAAAVEPFLFPLVRPTLPFPDVLFAREENQHVGRRPRFWKEEKSGKKSHGGRLPKSDNPSPSFCSPFFHLCIPTEFAASSPSLNQVNGRTSERAPHISRPSRIALKDGRREEEEAVQKREFVCFAARQLVPHILPKSKERHAKRPTTSELTQRAN